MTSRSLLWDKIVSKEEVLSDLVKGLNTCIIILCKGCMGNEIAARLKRWATSVVHWVKAGGLDVRTRMRRAKEYFAFCRQRAIDGKFSEWEGYPPVPFLKSQKVIDKRVLCHQISRVSRALRVADNETIQDSLESHWALAQCDFQTPDHLRNSFRRFVRDNFCSNIEPSTGSVGPSSSFLWTKKRGGVSGEVKEITDEFRGKLFTHTEAVELARRATDLFPGWKLVNPSGYEAHQKACPSRGGTLIRLPAEEVFFPYDKGLEMSLDDWEVQREVLFSLLACFDKLDLNVFPKCRQVAVAERGFKVRVATPLEAPFRYLLGVVNDGLLSSLGSMPQVVSSLHGRPAEKLVWDRGARRYNLVFSADLKSATDYLPQDLMLEAADVISANWPPFWRSLLLRGVGPHEMTSRDGSQTQLTKRGILMGSPVSWPMLSIYSAWLHYMSGSDGWFAVCGDDYLGCHTYKTYKSYLRIRSETGAIGSPGKDILGTQGVGVFAEELITVGRCRWVPTVSIRAVLADAKSGKPGWTQGPEVEASLLVLDLTDAQRGQVCEILHKDSFNMLRRMGIEPIGPRWVGCAGFPGNATTEVLRRARAMVSQSKEQVIKWITELEVAWSDFDSCPQLMERVLKEISESEIAQVPSEEPGQWGPMRDVVTSRLSALYWGYELAGVVKHTKVMSVTRLGRTIKRFCEEVRARSFWLGPVAEVVNPGGINLKLQELEPKLHLIPFRKFNLRYKFESDFADRKRKRLDRSPKGPGSPHWGVDPRKRARLRGSTGVIGNVSGAPR